MLKWQEVFNKNEASMPINSNNISYQISNLIELKRFLDIIHIKTCLIKPYQQNKNYPLVEGRDLLPSFDNDMFEYKDLPSFALVAFARNLNYFSEIFQYDKLHAESSIESTNPESNVISHNIQTFISRLPRKYHEEFRQEFSSINPALLKNYQKVLPYLLKIDRAHVFSWDNENHFHLNGIFASFPSDIDSELKRFGIKIGKFLYGDSEMYERNRIFVYQFLMELYGFPIASERRTASAIFARRLHKMGEHFLLRVLGQSDRTITTYLSTGTNRRYPLVEKIALIAVDQDQKELISIIDRDGFFLDKEKRIVIIKITYRQHAYDPNNVRQDRALSVAEQEILHPLTGQALQGLNIIKDSTNMFLRLNDIVRGEYTGRIVYKRTEIIENTDTEEKKLKFLYSWLTKHQRRIISYSDEFFNNVCKVMANYLKSPENTEKFESLREFHNEVNARFSYIQQARQVRILEDLCNRIFKGERIIYRKMLNETLTLLNDLQFELANFFPDLVEKILICIEKILHDKYLLHNYIEPNEQSLSKSGLEIKKSYGKLVALQDNFIAIRKARTANESSQTKDIFVA